MKLSMKASDLARELATAEKVVERKATIPVLSNVRLTTSRGKLAIEGTDLTMAFRSHVSAAIGEAGDITAPAAKLRELSTSFGDADVVLESEGDHGQALKVSSGRFTCRLQTLPVADFPQLPEMPAGGVANLPRAGLRTSLTRTRYAVTDKDKRYQLNGARLELNEKGIRIVATDGHRLALADVAHAHGSSGYTLLPRRAIDVLLAALDSEGTDVAFAQGENHLFFAADDRLLISRRLDGEYPQYERIIPKGHPLKVSIERYPLLVAIKRTLMVATGENKRVKFTLTKGFLSIASSSAEIGSADEQVQASYDSSEEFVFALDGSYAIDFLEAAGTDAVQMELKDPGMATVWKPASQDGYVGVIMPMRV